MPLKQRVLREGKRWGLFRPAMRLLAGNVRILCYHGISEADEHLSHPQLFMRPETFERRMAALARSGVPVVSLDEALGRLADGTLRGGETVITIDDGWAGVYRFALPVLERYRFPATVYVTTREVVHGAPVVNVAIEYLLARAGAGLIDLEGIAPRLSGVFDLGDPVSREAAADTLSRHILRTVPADDWMGWLLRIAERIGQERRAVLRTDLFRLMSAEEIAALARRADGLIGIELHTHTHRLSLDRREDFRQELLRNRDVLAELTGREPRHFCYPSGGYHPRCWPWLGELGVASAVTCLPGLNGRSTHPYELRRFLDGENISDIEFEAEIHGALEIARRLRGVLRNPAALPAPPQAGHARTGPPSA